MTVFVTKPKPAPKAPYTRDDGVKLMAALRNLLAAVRESQDHGTVVEYGEHALVSAEMIISDVTEGRCNR